MSPIHVAIQSGNIEMIDILLKHRPNLEVTNNAGQTALLMALESGSNFEQKSKTLLDAGANPTAPNEKGDSLLQILIRKGKVKPASLLIKHGQPDLIHSNEKSESVIHTVVLHQQKDLLKVILEKGVDIQAVMPDTTTDDDSKVPVGGSALHICLALNNFSSSELLMDKMAETGLKIAGDSSFHSALSSALESNKHSIAERLLELGADVDHILRGDSLLVHSILQQSESSCLFLLNNRADPNLKSQNSGETPLSLAVKNNLGKVVENLCIRGANKDEIDSLGNSALWNSLELEYFDISETIVEQGADLDFWQEKNGTEVTLLHRALITKNELAAVFLITNGADIHSAPRNLNTNHVIGGTLSRDSPEKSEFNGFDNFESNAPKSVEQILAEAEQNPFGSDDEDDNNPFGGSDRSSNPFGKESRSSRSSSISSSSKRPKYIPKTTEPQVPLHSVAEHGFLLVLNALLDRSVDLNLTNENGDTGT